MNDAHTLYVITGPTAVGKTQLSINWALEHNAEIISCDSLLFYQGMDIGTAKPDASQLSQVKHHGIDLVPVNEQYDVSRYLEYTSKKVEEIHARGKRVLITGGSGFYLKCFFAPVVDDVEISEELDEKVNSWFAAEGLSGVAIRLLALSPDAEHLIDMQNSRRVLPALKRCMASGKTVSALQDAMNQRDYPFARYVKQVILLVRSDESLRNNIRQRTRAMIQQGLIDEVKNLLENGLAENPSACNSIGYREVISMLNEEFPRDELEERINHNTWQLVRKQRKWFRHQLKADTEIDLDEWTLDEQALFETNE